MSARYILVTGATGKQGGAVLRSLLSPPMQNAHILALTRDPNSASAQKLAELSDQVTLVKGDLNQIAGIFSEIGKHTGARPLSGLFSVQAFTGNGATVETEEAQGKALVDAAVEHGVEHFVYSSVDRGGEQRSWANPTAIPHFRSKHNIEQHLRNAAGDKMGWTILRPTAFMENLAPGFGTRVFLAGLQNNLPEHKRLQWVSVDDIGHFAAEALRSPSAWNHRAMSLAGDELTVQELGQVFERQTGTALVPTFGLLGSLLTTMVGEIGTMIRWFGEEGYGAEIAALKAQHPGLKDMAAWVKTSDFAQSK